MKPKEFMSRWWEGIKTLSPRKQLESKMIGLWFTVCGIMFAGVMLILRGYWYSIFVLIGIIFLQVIEIIGTSQQYKNLKRVEKALEYPNIEDIGGKE